MTVTNLSADEVVERILALRALTAKTGCFTKRTQNELLASLPPELLMEVAVKLNPFLKNERLNERDHTTSTLNHTR